MSGTLMVVAPAAMARSKTWARKAQSERDASSAENSTLDVLDAAYLTSA